MASDCHLFNFIVWGVIGTILCCIGFVGNMLSLVTFQRDKRSPATTLLQCLASSDFILLLSVFVTDALPYICDHSQTCANPWSTWPYIRYIWILTPISHMCSIWFVVLIAANRYWAVCQPHSVNIMWNNSRTPFYVTGVLVLVISFNLPRFFEYKIVEIFDETQNTTRLVERKTEFGLTHSYKVAYKVMLVNIILVMIPIAALILFTGFILRGLHKQRQRLEAAQSSVVHDKDSLAATKAKSRARAASEITVVLVVVVIVAIVCQSPLAAFHFVRYSHDYGCGDVVSYLDNISKLLVNVNSSVNFLIYCLASPKFRTMLLTVILCKGAEKVGLAGVRGSVAKESRRNGAQPRDGNETNV